MILESIMDPADAGFWADLENRLDATHDVLEGIFFELLTSETLSAMGPSYD